MEAAVAALFAAQCHAQAFVPADFRVVAAAHAVQFKTVQAQLSDDLLTAHVRNCSGSWEANAVKSDVHAV